MVNMKHKIKKTKMSEAMELPVEREKYPYGLQISLDTEELKKLDIDVKDFEVGERIRLVCKAEVTNLSEHKDQPDKKRQSMSIQITDLEFDTLAGLSLKQMRALNE